MRSALPNPITIGPYHLREGFQFKPVYFGIDLRTGEQIALKEPKHIDTEDGRDALENGKAYLHYEHSLQSRLNHPNISPSEILEHQDEIFLVTPDLGRQTLANRKENDCLREERFQTLEDVAYALSHGHDRGVVHMDVKEENIIVSNKRATLIDYEAAREAGKQHPVSQRFLLCTEVCTAPEYMYGGEFSPRTDTFSYALMAYRILLNSEPFVIKNYKEGDRTSSRILYEDELYHPLEFEEFGKLGELLCAGLSLDAEKRPSMHEIAEAFTERNSKRRRRPSARTSKPSLAAY